MLPPWLCSPSHWPAAASRGRHGHAAAGTTKGVNPLSVRLISACPKSSWTNLVYSHVLPDMGDAAAGAMDAALG